MSVLNQLREKELKSFITRYGPEHPVTLSVKEQLKYRRPIEKVDNKIYHPIIKEMIGSALSGTDDRLGWVIADVQKYQNIDGFEFTLVLIHYTDEATALQRRHLRGLLLDVTRRRSITSTVGEIAYSIATSLREGDRIPMYRLNDMNTPRNVRPEQGDFILSDNIEITSTFEGVDVRLFLYDGIVGFCSKKKISLIKSVFRHTPFPELYIAGGGKPFSFFFDMEKRYSDKCYTLTIVAPELLAATKQPIYTPFIVLTDITSMEYNDVAIEDIGSKVIDWTQFKTVPAEPSPGIYLKSEFTIEQANEFLRDGFNNHVATSEKCRWGESVLMRDGEQYCRVMHPSYAVRRKIRGENNNITFRYVEFVEKMIDQVLRCPSAFFLYGEDVTKMTELMDIEENDKAQLNRIMLHKPLDKKETQALILAGFRLALPHALLKELDSSIPFIENIDRELYDLLNKIEDINGDCGVDFINEFFQLKTQNDDTDSYFYEHISSFILLDKLRLHRMLSEGCKWDMK